jgi:predicted small lipoprotein YifL
MRPAPLVLLLGCILYGCGLKGPLYIPTPEQRRETAERERVLKEREQREREEAQRPAPKPPPRSAPPSAAPEKVSPSGAEPATAPQAPNGSDAGMPGTAEPTAPSTAPR